MRQTFKYDFNEFKDVGTPADRGPEGPRAPKNRVFLIVVCGLSLAIHLGLLLLFPSFFESPSKLAPIKQAQVVFKEKTRPLKDKQLVTIAPSPDQTRPKDAKYLSTENHTAKKESKAALTSPSPENLSKAPVKLAAAPSSASPEINDKATEAIEVTMDAPTADDFFAKPIKPAKKDPLGLKKDLGGAGRANAQPLSDNLPGVKTGDETDLNTWQWRHAPFFNRVKAAVGRVWAPNVQISRYDPRGQLIGQKDRTTIMSVTIDHQGQLTDLKVVGTSGVAYLDEEAERTFRAAAPFPFPPKELFADMEVFTFNFAFHLEINRGLSFDFEWNKPH